MRSFQTSRTNTILPCARSKCKPKEMGVLDDMSLDKKQKLAEEESAMARTITDNMGSAVATWQHRQVQ